MAVPAAAEPEAVAADTARDVVETHPSLRRNDIDDLGQVDLWPAVAAA